MSDLAVLAIFGFGIFIGLSAGVSWGERIGRRLEHEERRPNSEMRFDITALNRQAQTVADGAGAGAQVTKVELVVPIHTRPVASSTLTVRRIIRPWKDRP